MSAYLSAFGGAEDEGSIPSVRSNHFNELADAGVPKFRLGNSLGTGHLTLSVCAHEIVIDGVRTVTAGAGGSIATVGGNIRRKTYGNTTKNHSTTIRKVTMGAPQRPPPRRQNDPLEVQPHGQDLFAGLAIASCAPWPGTQKDPDDV